jgi:hypothetical protein
MFQNLVRLVIAVGFSLSLFAFGASAEER